MTRDDELLGAGGVRALAVERRARRAAEHDLARMAGEVGRLATRLDAIVVELENLTRKKDTR